MRLIDGDELIQEFEKNIEIYESNEFEEGTNTGIRWCTNDVENAPTVEAIPVEQLLSILPKYDDYIHTKTYPYDAYMEDIYSNGHEEGWNACLKAIKEELNYWSEENEM